MSILMVKISDRIWTLTVLLMLFCHVSAYEFGSSSFSFLSSFLENVFFPLISTCSYIEFNSHLNKKEAT